MQVLAQLGGVAEIFHCNRITVKLKCNWFISRTPIGEASPTGSRGRSILTAPSIGTWLEHDFAFGRHNPES